MSVNASRSQNADLAEGMSDGSYKKIITDRGGNLFTSDVGGTVAARSDLSDAHYGIHEAKVKHLGDGTVHVTPDFQGNPLQPGGITFS